MTSTATTRAKRARQGAGLNRTHVDAVRQVLDAHPGLSLRKLLPFEAERCGLQVNEHSLHVFLAVHQIPRVVSAATFKRSERLVARGAVALSAPMVLGAPEGDSEPRKADIDEPPTPLPASDPNGIWAARERGRSRMRALRQQAHARATGWLQPSQLAGLAKLALEGALSHSQREPD